VEEGRGGGREEGGRREGGERREEVERLMIEFGGAIVDCIGDEVDRLEEEIQKAVPEAKARGGKPKCSI
jgi:hypothetical protein